MCQRTFTALFSWPTEGLQCGVCFQESRVSSSFTMLLVSLLLSMLLLLLLLLSLLSLSFLLLSLLLLLLLLRLLTLCCAGSAAALSVEPVPLA